MGTESTLIAQAYLFQSIKKSRKQAPTHVVHNVRVSVWLHFWPTDSKLSTLFIFIVSYCDSNISQTQLPWRKLLMGCNVLLMMTTSQCRYDSRHWLIGKILNEVIGIILLLDVTNTEQTHSHMPILNSTCCHGTQLYHDHLLNYDNVIDSAQFWLCGCSN